MGTVAGVRGHCHRGEALMQYRNQGPAGRGGTVTGVVWALSQGCGHCHGGEALMKYRNQGPVGVRGHCHGGEALMKYRNQGPAGVSGGTVVGVWCGGTVAGV